jgi:hypothetical protein
MSREERKECSKRVFKYFGETCGKFVNYIAVLSFVLFIRRQVDKRKWIRHVEEVMHKLLYCLQSDNDIKNDLQPTNQHLSNM